MIDMQTGLPVGDRSLLTELISVMASYLATNRLLLTERMIDKFFKRLN